jgi:hypothetical protein
MLAAIPTSFDEDSTALSEFFISVVTIDYNGLYAQMMSDKGLQKKKKEISYSEIYLL